ncbi:MAG TPA: sulfatase-like hydrolase/transferase, partial [Gemmatales bacterium]|nr:sulfatase-like hydrolase/transferase [Gemmatales bacterium]
IRYDAATMPMPDNFLPQHPFDNGEMTIRDEQLLPWPRTIDQVRQMNAEYYRYISHLDAQIGRILDALEASPHAKNTIIVFAADSGVARGSHGLIGKQNLYEHSIRVPLIMAGPGIPADLRTDAMCYLFDVMPTLGKLCGVNAPPTSQGIEFTWCLRDVTRPARSEMMFAYRNVQRAVYDGHWKLICYPTINKTQLFDIQTDPLETVDLSIKPEHSATLTRMMQLLKTEQQHFQDTCPLKTERPKPAAWTPPRQNMTRKK